jgi:hypothetical protein
MRSIEPKTSIGVDYFASSILKEDPSIVDLLWINANGDDE